MTAMAYGHTPLGKSMVWETLDADQRALAALRTLARHHGDGGPLDLQPSTVPESAPPTAAERAEAERTFFARWADGLRKAGRSTGWLQLLQSATQTNKEAAMTTQKDPDPFQGREVTGLYLAPDGQLVKQIRVGEDEPQQYAEPQPWDETRNADEHPDGKSPDGNPHGDARVLRRRRATDIEREIKIARRKARGAITADRERWDQELDKLSAELAQIRDAERGERDAYRRV